MQMMSTLNHGDDFEAALIAECCKQGDKVKIVFKRLGSSMLCILKKQNDKNFQKIGIAKISDEDNKKSKEMAKIEAKHIAFKIAFETYHHDHVR